MSEPELLVISGMSGSGKSSALRCFEDLGYYCVDNLPPPLIPTFVDLCDRASPRVARVAVVVDARTGDFLDQLAPVWGEAQTGDRAARLLFLDADDQALLQRFSETRRPHPLAGEGAVRDGIVTEREKLAPIRALADEVIDTSQFNVKALRDYVLDRFRQADGSGLKISVVSFAFRNGLVENADLVFDVRFLPNPHYDHELRPLTGLDSAVREYVESRPETTEFLGHAEQLLQFLIPQYAAEGKTYLTLAFGCTGGKHRSVAIASIVEERLRQLGYTTSVKHADLQQSPSLRAGPR